MYWTGQEYPSPKRWEKWGGGWGNREWNNWNPNRVCIVRDLSSLCRSYCVGTSFKRPHPTGVKGNVRRRNAEDGLQRWEFLCVLLCRGKTETYNSRRPESSPTTNRTQTLLFCEPPLTSGLQGVGSVLFPFLFTHHTTEFGDCVTSTNTNVLFD